MKKLIFAMIIGTFAAGSIWGLSNAENARMISLEQKTEATNLVSYQ